MWAVEYYIRKLFSGIWPHNLFPSFHLLLPPSALLTHCPPSPPTVSFSKPACSLAHSPRVSLVAQAQRLISSALFLGSWLYTPTMAESSISCDSDVPAKKISHEQLILEMTKTLLASGCPSHHLEEHIRTAANFLEISLDAICLPNTVFLSFHPQNQLQHGRMHILREKSGLVLYSLSEAHELHRKLLKGTLAPSEALKKFHDLQCQPVLLSPIQRCSLAFVCAFCFTIASAQGSVLDSAVAALEMVFLVVMTHCYHGSALLAQAIQYALINLCHRTRQLRPCN